MTPLTCNPRVTILLNEDGKVLQIATNVAADLRVRVIQPRNALERQDSRNDFDLTSQGEPFKFTPSN